MLKTMFQQKNVIFVTMKWNIIDQTRFFAVKNGCDKLLYTYLEYENNLYMEK